MDAYKLMVILFGALVVAVSAESPPIAESVREFEDELSVQPLIDLDQSYRLPEHTVPTHYTIHLRTNVHAGDPSFQGTVEIDLDVLEATNSIVVHNRDLSIGFVSLYSVDVNGVTTRLENPAIVSDLVREHVAFETVQVLSTGSYRVVVEYAGRMQTNSNTGAFMKSYVNDEGVRRYLATTQFEPTRARMLFPCYDEPLLKASITLWITHHSEYTAVSNMPVASVDPDIEDPSYVTTKFLITPKMSTYLLAFGVSDFSMIQSGNQQVYARPNAIHEADHALEAGVKILEALAQYVNVSYYDYMPKLSQMAIPDRGSGAMENWGLVKYGEPALLFNPAINTYRAFKGITVVISHEYAHQWFGDLVGPYWWKYIWLNEGFAELYGYVGAHLAYPEYNFWDLYNVENIQNAFGPDAEEDVRPMNQDATSASDISGLFDTIAYDKSGSVINMFRHVLGDDNFRAGLTIYLKNKQLSGAVADDLFEGLQAAIEGKGVIPDTVTVKTLMDSWADFGGYPVLNVRRNYETGTIIISQDRYLSGKRVPNDHIWYIPYNYATESNANFEDVSHFDWLATKAERISTEATASEWIIFNKQQTGYYRVNYDLDNWEMIIAALLRDPTSIHRFNRAQLVNDAFNLARSERLDMGVALDLSTYLKNEHEYAPWAAGTNVLTYFYNKLRGTPHYHNFLTYADSILADVFTSFSITSVPQGETLLDKYLKQLVSTWACRLGYTQCLSETAAAFRNAVQTNTKVHPDVSYIVYCYGTYGNGDAEYQWLYQQMISSNNEAERTVLIDALACSQDKEQLKSLLTAAMGSGSEFDSYLSSERSRVVSAMYSASRAGVDALIEFLSDPTMAGEFVNVFGAGTLNTVVSNVASRTNNDAELAQLEGLLTALGTRVSQATATAARTTVQNSFAWFSTLEGEVGVKYFEDYANEMGSM